MNHSTWRSLVPYGFALLASALAILVRLACDPIFGTSYPYATLFIAVLASAGIFGVKAGLVSLVVGQLAATYFLLLPRFSFALHSQEDMVGLLVDGLVGLSIVLLAGAMHSARARLKHALAAQEDERMRLEVTLDGLGEGVLSTDATGRVLALNLAAEGMTGFNESAAVGRPITTVLKREAECLIARDGRALPVEIAERRVPRTHRSEVTSVWIVRDETSRRELESAKQKLERREASERERVALERERQLQIVVARAPVAIAMLDADLCYIVASPKWSTYFGLDEHRIVGRSHLELFPALDPSWHDVLARCLAGASERAEEEAVTRADGSVAWYRWEIEPWSRSAGRTDGIIIYTEDITARKLAHDALRASEARMRMIIEAARDYAIYMLDAEGRIVTWSTGAERMLGCSAAQAIGQPFSQFYTPEDGHDVRARALEAAASAGRWSKEGWCLRPDGTRFWAEGVVTPIRDQGALLGFVKVDRDITARRRSEGLQRAVIDNAFDTIVSIDQQGTIESFNAAGERLFGYSSDEVVGKNVKMLMPDPYHKEHDQYLSHYLRTGEAKIIGIGRQVRGRRKDGGVFPLELAITEFRFDSERHFTGILRDLTERHQLEDQLRQASKMEAVGRLAGGVAHDFNNILFVILGYGQMLLDRARSGAGDHTELKELVAAAERASELTRQLLMFSRHHHVEAQVVDAQQVVAKLHRMLSRLVGEHIRVQHRGTPNNGRVRIQPNYLEQVVMNLVVNARDAMPDGGEIELHIEDVVLDDAYARSHLGVKAGTYVALHVADTGTGMDEQVRARIFEPFFTTKPKDKGTGLGLSMVLNIVQQAHGSIRVRSEVGLGTRVSIYLPAVDAAPEVVPRESRRPVRAGSETILLVEDEAAVRQVATQILESHGYVVVQAINGGDALQRFGDGAHHVDLLVTDVVMPQIDGMRLAERMRARRPGLPVLFMSGYTDDTIARSSAVELNTANFLNKPTTPEELLTKVRELLDRPSRADVESEAG